jgi:hypothetical protein
LTHDLLWLLQSLIIVCRASIVIILFAFLNTLRCSLILPYLRFFLAGFLYVEEPSRSYAPIGTFSDCRYPRQAGGAVHKTKPRDPEKPPTHIKAQTTRTSQTYSASIASSDYDLVAHFLSQLSLMIPI